MNKRDENKQSGWQRIKPWVWGLVPFVWYGASIAALGVIYGHWQIVVVALKTILTDDTMQIHETLLMAGEALRNLALILAAILSFPLVVWRGMAADKQATAAIGQLADAEKQRLQNLYDKGRDMLASDNIITRIEGIQSLAEIASGHVEAFHIRTMEALCQFMRHRKWEVGESKMDADGNHPPDDVKEVASVISTRSERQIEFEKSKNWTFKLDGVNLTFAPLLSADLSNARLSSVRLPHANLSSANLSHAVLSYAHLGEAGLLNANLSRASLTRALLREAVLSHANLSKAVLEEANLIGAELNNADLTGASLVGADLTGADLTGVKGLTQAQLDKARAKKGKPPILPEGLEWKGEEYEGPY